MSHELAVALHRSGDAHAGAACLLYKASLEHAVDEGIPDPVAYAFNGPNSLSVHYLLGLGFELLLKATIVARDPAIDAKYLKYEIGHNLAKALSEAERRGFQSEAEHLRGIVELLDIPYSQHWLRYEQPDQIPLPGNFDQVIQTLKVFESEVATLVT